MPGVGTGRASRGEARKRDVRSLAARELALFLSEARAEEIRMTITFTDANGVEPAGDDR